VGVPEHCDPSLDPGLRSSPVALEKMNRARGDVEDASGVCVLHRLGEPVGLGLVPCRLGEAAQRGEAHDQPVAVEDRGGRHGPEELVGSVGRQQRQGGGCKLNHRLVFAPKVVNLFHTDRGTIRSWMVSSFWLMGVSFRSTGIPIAVLVQ
jgi:hypothetical protein